MAIETLADIRQISMAEESEEYAAFVAKFKPKHTTDDCFTPDNIFETVKAWVFERYKLPEGTRVIRPFYPGGDYQREEYPDGCVVIDNPPFSIAAQIADWYQAHGVRFFLFANGLTCGSIVWMRKGLTAVCTGLGITYDNGARIGTNFITNLSPGIMAESAPDLHDKLKAVNAANEKATKKVVTKLALPMEVLTAARLNWLAIHGERFTVREGDAVRVAKLDNYRKGVFGSGLLLSERVTAERAVAERAAAERAAAERAVAERAAAERVPLSDREKALVKALGKG